MSSVSLRLAPLIAAFLLAACTGLGGEPEIAATIPPRTVAPTQVSAPLQPPDLNAGSLIFAENCTRCHGASGAGDGELVLAGQVGDPGNFTQPITARAQSPQDWFDTITNGRLEQLMPPWGDSLSAQQRWDVALYTYTMHYTADQIAAGETIWAANCDENCNALPDIGAITDLQAMASVSDVELREALPESITEDEDAWAVVAYLRTRTVQNADVIGQPPPQPQAAAQVTAPPNVPATGTPETVAQAETGVISGQITNGTDGVNTGEGITVRLFRWDSSFAPMEPMPTTTDADGHYQFENIEIDPTFSYAVAVDYQNSRFISDFVRGTSNPLELPVTIYEPTEDPGVITISGIVNQLTAVGNGVQVVQVLNFQNTSDRFYSTSDEVLEGQFASVVISLPPGSTVIGFPNDQERFVVSEDQTTVVDTLPVLPGQDHLIQLVYLVPYEGDAIIEQPLNYALDGQVRLLLRPDTLSVVSDSLQEIGPQAVGENTFKGYGGNLQLGADEALSFELRGAPAPEAAQIEQPGTITSNNLLAVGGLALIVIGLVMAGLYFFYRRGKSSPDSESDERLIDGLIQQIAELDEAHEQGQINHDVYRRQRQRLKDRLSELMGESDE